MAAHFAGGESVAPLAPRLDYAYAKGNGVVLLSAEAPWRVGMRSGANSLALVEVRRVLGAPFEVVELAPPAFDEALSKAYAVSSEAARSIAQSFEAESSLDALADSADATADLLDSQDDAPVIRLINGLIAEAISQGASDIHIEPYENTVVVRLRIDGALREVLQAPSRLRARLVSRIKVMARLDIAEKRLPQDGRISLTLGGRGVDVRVSTLPSRYGERVVMRLLDKDQGLRSLDALGMSHELLDRFKASLRTPNGIVLVTGPTGSGKTTTLYAALNLLNDQTRNILTVEDPIEYAIDGVGQTQVNAKVGMTFAAGLRAILRQDPDVVMVGEIRDAETAQIAVQASLTGHLVFSTVHTNDAVAAITRLKDMGVEPYLLASTLRAIVAQRLVRRLCNVCKKPAVIGAQEREMLRCVGAEDTIVYEGVGCPQCRGSGYVGRIGLYEFVAVDDEIRRLIHVGANEQEMGAYAFRAADPLMKSGLKCVAAGITSLSDVLRAASAA
ncbi:type II secretion system ATPase GspE [Vitreimonas sp.]|uniref:type II secretion system ATPase GspE n=1 Tax=Vitreimonas sp. TaxID=3069702 RepID=UPI002EDB7C35